MKSLEGDRSFVAGHVEKHVQLNCARLNSYDVLREEIRTYCECRGHAAPKRETERFVTMDIGAFGKGKGKQGKEKHGKCKGKGKQGQRGQQVQQGRDRSKDKDENKVGTTGESISEFEVFKLRCLKHCCLLESTRRWVESLSCMVTKVTCSTRVQMS